jgi:hypothetical protein
MEWLDGLWHLLNFFLPALVLGVLTATLAKGLWRGELKGVAWSRLAVWGVLASAAASIGGLVALGRDGRMATYGAMVVACALALWCAGWLRR